MKPAHEIARERAGLDGPGVGPVYDAASRPGDPWPQNRKLVALALHHDTDIAAIARQELARRISFPVRIIDEADAVVVILPEVRQ